MVILPVCPPGVHEYPILANNGMLLCFNYLLVLEEKGCLSFLLEFLAATSGCVHSDNAELSHSLAG